MNSDFNVTVIPAWSDNYNFVFSSAGETAVVDPTEAPPIVEYLEKNDLNLTHILNTHHHPDHIGGNEELRKKYNCRIVCSHYDSKNNRIDHVSRSVGDGDVIRVGDIDLQVIDVPGHTLGHIAYYHAGGEALFCGDTLFSLGCGRLFEGSAEQMFQSIAKLKQLPDSTRIFCAHEYTLANARFVESMDGEIDDIRQDLQNFIQSCQKKRDRGEFTIPASLGVEKKLNPFVRAGSADEFAHYRKAKDNF